MARIRSLKPGFFTNEHLAELPFEARLCFAGLWTLADREGRLEDRPRRIKAALFPYDTIDIDRLLDGLASREFIVRYAADGAAYIAIPTWHTHQRPKTDETASSIPPHVSSDPRGKSSPPRTYNGQRTERSGQGTEGGGADVAPIAADVPSVEALADLWNTVTAAPLPRCRDLTSKRRRHIKSRLTERSLDDWGAVFKRIQASSFCRGDSDRGWIASFDWAIGSPDVAVKVLEGKYDDRVRGKSEPAQSVAAVRYQDWTPGSCPHTPTCVHPGTCLRRQDLDAEKHKAVP